MTCAASQKGWQEGGCVASESRSFTFNRTADPNRYAVSCSAALHDVPACLRKLCGQPDLPDPTHLLVSVAWDVARAFGRIKGQSSIEFRCVFHYLSACLDCLARTLHLLPGHL